MTFAEYIKQQEQQTWQSKIRQLKWELKQPRQPLKAPRRGR